MKKEITKLLSIVVCLLVLIVLTACNGIGPQTEPAGDKTKTILRIGNLYSGLGDDWLTTIEKNFEEAYANTSFEEGKIGVDLVIDNSGSYSGAKVLEISDKNDIWMSYLVDYYDLVSRGLALEITDVVTSDLGDVSPSEAGVTIESKMSPNIKETFKTIGNNKYYGLPFYETYYGIVYDVDLFNENDFYFIKDYDRNGSLVDMFVSSASDPKSCGPDGEYGTYDDGLPETYEDFYNLCRYILAFNVIPMCYPGQFMHYWLRYFFQVWADYEGEEQMSLNFSLSGNATDLVDISSDDALLIKDSSTITSANSYELQKQAGKYYTLKFAKTLATNSNWFSQSSRATGQSQEMNQKEFLYSRKKTPIAMCLDGSWFNCESDSAYTDMVNSGDKTAGRYTRNIGFMPVPKATADKVGEKQTIVDSSRSIVFISSKIDEAKIEAAKLFMKYFHTNESLAIWTYKTETTRPYSYTVDETKLSSYGKSIMNIHNNSTIIFPYSTNLAYLQNFTIFNLDSWAFTTTKGYSNPFTTFRDTQVTIKDYFDGMYSSTKASVESAIR